MKPAAITFPFDVKRGSTTVRIYKTVDRERERFMVPYYEGARRKVKGFADFGEAKREAGLIAERLNKGQQSALELTGKDRDSYVDAVAKLASLGISLTSAIDEYIDAKSLGVPLKPAVELYFKMNCESLPPRTVSQVVEELYVAKKVDGVSSEYLRSLRSYLGHFAREFQDEISRITTQDIDAWLRALKKSPRSRNNYRTSIITLFRFAKASGYLRKDGETVADGTSLAKRHDAEIEVFTPAEMVRLLANGGEATPFLVLGGFCGLRSAEVDRLKWEDLDWSEKVINIKSSVAKTRTRRLPPLPDAALAWLRPYENKKGLIIYPDKQRVAMRKMLQKSGVVWKKNALRHSFGTYRMAVIKDPVRVAFEMGNSPSIIRAHYDRVVTESVGKEWFGIMP